MKRTLISSVAALSLAACSFGPKYSQPPVSAPAEFKEGQGWKPANPAQVSSDQSWWAMFADPDLDAAALGDSLLLGSRFDGLPESEVAREFGEDFAKALADLPVGGWQGPVKSGYGAHLVRITRRDEGDVPSLAQSREAVRREWSNAQRTTASEAFYRGLLARYSVTIERPRAIADGGKPDLAAARP